MKRKTKPIKGRTSPRLICVTQKIGYPSGRRANEVLDHLKKHKKGYSQLARVYWCHLCGNYHLTKNP